MEVIKSGENIFVSNDGKIFLSDEKCLEYEQNKKKWKIIGYITYTFALIFSTSLLGFIILWGKF